MMPLERETAWSRRYAHPDGKRVTINSRFEDGSASLTLPQLRAGWIHWSESEKIDLCQNFSWLSKQADFPEMIRFIMREGSWQVWAAVALQVATQLPQEEAFMLLSSALQATPLGSRSNVVQALARTRHPLVPDLIGRVLLELRSSAEFLSDDPFVNWIALSATWCIEHLLDLGARPEALEDAVRSLSDHPCSENRARCAAILGDSYPWLRAHVWGPG